MVVFVSQWDSIFTTQQYVNVKKAKTLLQSSPFSVNVE